ncbi:MAG: hypothetical protein R3F60_14845 [bacterium]
MRRPLRRLPAAVRHTLRRLPVALLLALAYLRRGPSGALMVLHRSGRPVDT